MARLMRIAFWVIILIAVVQILSGCTLGIRAEGCDVLAVVYEGIPDPDALPVKPIPP